MALIIKHTPTLEGKTSARFNELISIQKSIPKNRIIEIKAMTEKIWREVPNQEIEDNRIKAYKRLID